MSTKQVKQPPISDDKRSMHVGKYRQAPVNVDYIFLGACLGYVHGILLQAIFTLDDIDVSVRLAIAQAWGKIIWMQNDLFARWQIAEATSGVLTDEMDRSSQTSEPISCPFSGNSSATGKLSEDEDMFDAQSRTESTTRSIHGSTRMQPVSAYRLMHIAPRNGPGMCPRLSNEIQELISKARIVNDEELSDGSRELLGTGWCLEALKDAIKRSNSGQSVTVNLNYDPWSHSTDNEAYFGYETASTLHESWTILRLQRLAKSPGLVGQYYGKLLERRAAGVDRHAD